MFTFINVNITRLLPIESSVFFSHNSHHLWFSFLSSFYTPSRKNSSGFWRYLDIYIRIVSIEQYAKYFIIVIILEICLKDILLKKKVTKYVRFAYIFRFL